ncbi:acyl-CoA dehydrogenase family protein [Rhodococcus fascians]|nr:acyl-CoA dehydrogenase family protein [Rhodococcus fascians]MBY4237853.1 acyl-CoA dehydrogenase family protein [Rhodococcus fascians]MBY4253396.1 acyl-CoA dehydrogenase family protein [Rhodococcus fascians]MBY4269033.1 acyl-CoA dehydrogenase family protein [Rhodococcus fascians]MBY4275086.1 acyl-CoA dehydrogenase family protein [Rhodococcus fascians]
MSISRPLSESPWPRSEPAALTAGPEQESLRDAARGILGRHSSLEQVRAASATEAGYSDDQWARLVDDMSVTTLAMPESDGGLGYGMVELGIILEECGRSLASEPIYSSAVLGIQALTMASRKVDAGLLEAVRNGTAIAAVSALTPDFDQVEATRSDDGWVVSGQVLHVVGGAHADVAVASSRSTEGLGVYAVTIGDQVTRKERAVLDPTRRQADLVLENAPATLLALDSDADRLISHLRDLSTLALSCENTGLADALLEMTVAYVKTRNQFGRAIGSFQAVKHRLADLLMEVERARSAARYAAAVYDQDPDEAHLAIAVAGAVCSDAAIHAAHEVVQLHGGVGFTWEHAAHSYFRRAMGNEGIQGNSRTHRARIADLIGI